MPDLEILFNPKSVAVIGASTNSSKWGNWIANDLLKHKDKRNIYLISQNQSIADIPETLDLAVVCVPINQFETVINQLLNHNTKAIIGITSGFGEKNEHSLEQNIINKIKANDKILIGPNCAGIWDAYSPIYCLPIGNFKKGHVGVISQSGGVIVDLANRLKEVNIGYSRVISVGNQSGINLIDLINNLVNDKNTKVIAIYYEDIKNLPIEDINNIKKPVIIFAPHATSAAIRAAKNHTNSNLIEISNVEKTMTNFVAAIQFELSSQFHSSGRRTVIVSDTGGLGVIIAATAETNGLVIDELSTRLKNQLKNIVSRQSTIDNPIDLVGESAGFSQHAVDVMTILQDSDEFDNIIMNIHLETDSKTEYKYSSLLAEVVKKGNKKTIFTCFNYNNIGVKVLLKYNIPVYRDIDTAVTILKGKSYVVD